MALNINGTTGISGVDGSISAPALTGTDSNTGITFPSADTIKFSTGGVERISITNSGISGTGIGSGGKFASYAIICDQKATNYAGGSSSAGAFNTRDLNTELSDPDGIVSISSNQFTLQAGSYLIKASAPAHGAARHQIIIWNATDSSIVAIGTSEYSNASHTTTSRAFATGRTTISGAKAFEIRHRVGTAQSGDGLGVESNFDTLATIYTVVEIYKES